MNYAVEVRNLTKIFQPGIGFYDLLIRPRQSIEKFKALNNINLTIPAGSVFALLGPNGAGKTTLLKILATLIYPDGGYAAVGGYDVVRQELEAKRSIGMLINDERSFYWRLTGYQNLEFFACLDDLTMPNARKRIGSLCEILEITDPHKRYQEYSTGVKQRIALARALLRDPGIILMDEPTRSIDPVASRALRNIIKRLVAEDGRRTVFFVTHDPDEAEDIADTIAVMDRGSLRVCGGLDTLRAKAGMPGSRLSDCYEKLLQDQ
ncbi:MAG: ABC transporter ATP-binding protein [Candidatus Omnitrophota bacterium]